MMMREIELTRPEVENTHSTGTVPPPPLCNEDKTVMPSREELLHKELVEFIDLMHARDYEREARVLVSTYISNIIQSQFPEARVTLFGSRSTGLELPNSDLDLVVDFNNKVPEKGGKKISELGKIGHMLRSRNVTTKVTNIFHAKVPIIKFRTTYRLGAFDVDICIKNEADTAVQSIAKVKQYIEEIPALRPLVIITKAFLSMSGMNNAATGTLGSFAIINMCISFLQRNPAELDSSFLSRPFETKGLGHILMGFFSYYAFEFPFETHYISVSEGGIFPKTNKKWTKKGPPTISIQCLFDPDKDITRGASKIRSVLHEFGHAFRLLGNTKIEPGISLLRQIMPSPQCITEGRENIRKIMNDGTLQAATSIALNADYTPQSTRRPFASQSQRNYSPQFSYGRQRGAAWKDDYSSRYVNRSHPYSNRPARWDNHWKENINGWNV